MFRSIDEGLLHALNSVQLPPGLNVLISGFSGNPLLRALVLALPYVYLWCRYSSLEVRTRLVTAILAAAGAVVIARILAHLLPFSLRPMYDPHASFHPLNVPFQPDMENWSSFPSDTAALCTAVTLGFFSIAPRLSVLLTGLSFLLFVLPRIYLGVHYPSDIAAGMLIGAGCATLATIISRREQAQRLMDRFALAHPQAFYPTALLALFSTTQMFDGLRGLLWSLRSAF